MWVIIPPLVRWVLIDSLWMSTGAECQQAEGACWSVISANWRFITFGFYPYDQQWRPFVAMALLVALLFYSRNRDHWKEPLAYAWIVGLFVMGLLMGSMTYFTLFLFLQVPILVLFIIVLIKQIRPGGVFNRIIGVVEIVGLILLIIVIPFKPGGVLLGFIRIVIGIAGLGFLGIGVQPPTPEWGTMLGSARSYLFYAPHVATFPGIAIFLAVLSFNLLGDGLRDALDPRFKI